MRNKCTKVLSNKAGKVEEEKKAKLTESMMRPVLLFESNIHHDKNQVQKY